MAASLALSTLRAIPRRLSPLLSMHLALWYIDPTAEGETVGHNAVGDGRRLWIATLRFIAAITIGRRRLCDDKGEKERMRANGGKLRSEGRRQLPNLDGRRPQASSRIGFRS